jgi:hypothetical protein
LPRLQLALPLPLGVEGLGEWFDLESAGAGGAAPWCASGCRPSCPWSFRLLSAEAVPVCGPSLSQELVAAHWRIALKPVLAGSAASAPTTAQWRASPGGADALLMP